MHYLHLDRNRVWFAGSKLTLDMMKTEFHLLLISSRFWTNLDNKISRSAAETLTSEYRINELSKNIASGATDAIKSKESILSHLRQRLFQFILQHYGQDCLYFL